ncbi:MAG: hypothetical protein NTZ56_18765 [Acidobacteria bacterium]|nr:hypothetical protein [Acidobacteriota bacterium]
MPVFRLHRIKDNPREHFRWSAHAAGTTLAKPRDYEPGEEFTAASSYALWETLRGTPAALQLGDILEGPDGGLRIYKYVGFEEAQWQVPAVLAGPLPEAAAAAAAAI